MPQPTLPKITKEEFRSSYGMAFPILLDTEYDSLLENCIGEVYDVFWGVDTLWDWCAWDEFRQQTKRCYLLLVAWWIADLYPQFVSGTPTLGGLPNLKSKKIGHITLAFNDTNQANVAKGYLDQLALLKTNPWGNRAYLMITTAAKRWMLYSKRNVSIGGQDD